MEICFDTLGSEKSAAVVAEAGIRFFAETAVRVCLVGNTSILESCLKSAGLESEEKIRIVDAHDVIPMDASPSEMLSRKVGASINVAMLETRNRSNTAVISPGHTGATVLAAKTHWGLLPGIERACLCQMIPSFDGRHVLLSDAGASVQAHAVDMYRYAVMTSEAARLLMNRTTPEIALLNIGSESCKGDKRLLDTFRMMKESLPGFTGNTEGHHIWYGAADAIITDGITGNILIKSSEGLILHLLNAIRSNLSPSSMEKLNKTLHHFNPSQYGGAMLLGVNGICIVCHGKAASSDMVGAARLALKCIQMNLVENITSALQHSVVQPDTSEKGDLQ